MAMSDLQELPRFESIQMTIVTILDLPLEIIEIISLSLDFWDVVSMMTTCSTLWHLRYNFSFWRQYHQSRFGSTFLLERLGDPYKSTRRRAYARWNLAEKVIDIIYALTSREHLFKFYHSYIFGGYLRDRLARRLDFRDINLSITHESLKELKAKFPSLLYNYGLQIAPYPDPDTTSIYTILDKNNPGISVNLRITQKHIDDIAVDFDVNSLYLKDRRTLALRVPSNRGDAELNEVIDRCRKKLFSLTHTRVRDLDHLGSAMII